MMETLKSLDPRVTRLPEINIANSTSKEPLDQLGSFEVFVQPKEGKSFQHEGALHASDVEMAFVLAKEAFTRRFLCTSLWVVATERIFVSAFTDGNKSVYETIEVPAVSADPKNNYEVFHLTRRGKQHVHTKTVAASSPAEAIHVMKSMIDPASLVYNIWVIRTSDIRMTKDEEKDLWNTLPDKKFRDAAAYKGGDKLKDFLEKSNYQKR